MGHSDGQRYGQGSSAVSMAVDSVLTLAGKSWRRGKASAQTLSLPNRKWRKHTYRKYAGAHGKYVTDERRRITRLQEKSIKFWMCQ